MELGQLIFMFCGTELMSNYVIKVYDKDMTFKQTLPWDNVDWDVNFTAWLNSGLGDMSLKIFGRWELQDWVWGFTENLWIEHGDFIKIIDPDLNVVTDVIYKWEYYTFDWVDDYVISNATHSANLTSSSHVMVSFWFRLNDDWVATDTSQPLFCLPFCYGYVRETTNDVRIRYDNAGAKESYYSLGTWERQRHHYCAVVYNNGSTRRTELYIDNALVDSDNHASAPSTDEWGGWYVKIWTALTGTTFLKWDMRDFHIRKFTWTTVVASDISDTFYGRTPTETVWITEYLNWWTDEWSWTNANDKTVNNRDGTLTWGVTHVNETTSLLPFSNYYKSVVDVPIYTGVVNEVRRVIEERSDYHIVGCLWLQVILNHKLYEYLGSTTFTRTADPSVILKEIIDLYPDTHLTYTVWSIPLYWTTVSITFTKSTCFDAVKQLTSVTGWYVRFDADWMVYFFEQVASPTEDHVLRLGYEINSILKVDDSTEIVNDLILAYNWGTTTATDATSITSYWTREKYISDTTLSNLATADEYASAYIAKYKDPKQNIEINVNNRYAISSIKAWQVVKVLWDPIGIGTKYIQKIAFNTDQIKIRLYENESIEKSLAKLVWR